MKRSFFAVAAIAAATWLIGCGGGGGGGTPPPPGDKFTRAVVNIHWPERSRALDAPSSALSVVITIKGSKQDGTDLVWTINRPSSPSDTTVRHVSPTAEVKVGTWDVTIAFHAQADGAGAVVATGGARVAIAEDGTGLDAIALTGTIATVEVPAGQSVPTGVKKDLIFTAKDSGGAVIAVTPGSAVWKVVTGTDKLRFVNGQAEAIGDGTATVTATVDNKTSAAATVVVGATTGTLVVNVKDGASVLVKPATVQIYQGATKLQEKATSTGTATFTNVPAGTIDIKATATGYQPGQTTATVTVGVSTTKDVTVIKNGGLIAQIKDPTGSLIPGALIQIWQGGVKVAEKTSTTGAETFTNLAPGATEIRASSAAFHDASGTTTVVSGQTVTKDVVLVARGKPQASISPTRQTALNGATATFDFDVSVKDENGNHIPGLAPSAFVVDPVAINGTTYTFTLQSSVETSATNSGPYSAFLELDASESVGVTDPKGSRIQAAKTFFTALGPNDNAAFGYFPDAPGGVNLVAYPSIGFVGPTNVSLYYQKLDELSKKLIPGTPLYTATSQAIDFTATLGSNPNKAVIVFTDGESTEAKSKRTLMINNAIAKGVKVYMVGLGSGTDTAELALIAQSTGGSVMYATDAAQLVSFYRTLGSLLSGTGTFYRQTWKITKSSGNFVAGEAFAAKAKITLPDSTVLEAPFYVEIR
jgi:hypothetical protein